MNNWFNSIIMINVCPFATILRYLDIIAHWRESQERASINTKILIYACIDICDETTHTLEIRHYTTFSPNSVNNSLVKYVLTHVTSNLKKKMVFKNEMFII